MRNEFKKKDPSGVLKFFFFYLFPEILNPPPLSHEEKKQTGFTKKSQEWRKEKVRGKTAKSDERQPLSTCMLSKLIPPSAKSSHLIFICCLNHFFSVLENVFHNLNSNHPYFYLALSNTVGFKSNEMIKTKLCLQTRQDR